ncbi:hypothetical protein Syun_027925 [Stephania yunnanensis]|uniref:Uncharacterized protein n=1 Tax=Stephania yunnanensis TaxID=152371 RepID=A0AAP0HN93_9MAGN
MGGRNVVSDEEGKRMMRESRMTRRKSEKARWTTKKMRKIDELCIDSCVEHLCSSSVVADLDFLQIYERA